MCPDSHETSLLKKSSRDAPARVRHTAATARRASVASSTRGRSRTSRPAAGEHRARPRAASPPPPRTVPPPLMGHLDIWHSATKKVGRGREGECRGSQPEPALPTAALPIAGCRDARDLPIRNCRGRLRWLRRQFDFGSSALGVLGNCFYDKVTGSIE